MKILKCSLVEFKETFPSYKPDEENRNLVYHKVELKKGIYIGVIKDSVTHLFEFVDTDNANKVEHNYPNFEYEVLSLIADKYEPRDFDTPIVPPNDIDWDMKEEELDKELKKLDRDEIRSKLFNAWMLILVLIIFYFSFGLRGK